MSKRTIHSDFWKHLERKEQGLIDLYLGLRDHILSIHPNSNELLYHTHALTSLYSVSEKMSDGFCMIVVYTNHLNLAFNEGTLLPDPHKLLQGTGKLMRHIPILIESDFKNKNALTLIESAIEMAIEGSTAKTMNQGLTISKIKN
tara:strand:+ start:1951 stop:2385 length:435 start_codon:yes stop_codon:yes gene_type:complete